MSASTTVKLRGKMEVNGVNVPSNSRSGLIIAYLCSKAGHSASRGEVCAALWPEKDRELQQLSLRQALFQAQKLIGTGSDRHSIWLVGAESDIEGSRELSGESLLKDWSHPWVKDWREKDRKRSVTQISKIVRLTEEPFQKVELLLKLRELEPLDEDVVDQLKEQYLVLGWSSEISKLEDAFAVEKAVNEAIVGLHQSPPRFVESLEIETLHATVLSKYQRLDLALSLFPIYLSQGNLKQGIAIIQELKKDLTLGNELDLRVRYSLARLAIASGDRALAFAQSKGLKPGSTQSSNHGLICFILGIGAYAKGRFAQSIRLARQGLRDKSNSADLNSELYGLISASATYVHQHKEGVQSSAQGLVFARQTQNKFQEVVLRTNGLLCRRAFDPDLDIEKELLAIASICQEEGYNVRLCSIYGTLGQQYQLKGDLKRAEEVLRRSVAISESIRNDDEKAISLDYLGEVLVRANKLQEAVLVFQQATLLHRQLNDKLGVATSYRGAGRGLILLEEYEFALKMFDQALANFQALENDILVAGCLLYRSIVLAKMSKINLAEEAIALAASLLKSKELDAILHASDPDLHPILREIAEGNLIAPMSLVGLYRK